MFKLLIDGVSGEGAVERYEDPVSLEAAYLRICSQTRTPGPGSVKILTPGMSPAYFRLDRDWGPEAREHEPERLGLWTGDAQGYQPPTESQLRGAARTLGVSGEGMARRLGISGRQWRYYLAGEREMPFSEWRCIRLWLGDC